MSRDKRLTSFEMAEKLKAAYQEDQGGWPFVLIRYIDYDPTAESRMVERYHHLSAEEAEALAAELLQAARKVKGL